MVKRSPPLTPITDIRRARGRSGRPEIWSARSTDGTWTYERDESPGTPWAVTHNPTGRWDYMPSLRKARAATASGAMLDLLNTNQPQT